MAVICSKYIFRDSCSSELNDIEFKMIKDDLNEILNNVDIEQFKELSKKFADYGKEDKK